MRKHEYPDHIDHPTNCYNCFKVNCVEIDDVVYVIESYHDYEERWDESGYDYFDSLEIMDFDNSKCMTIPNARYNQKTIKQLIEDNTDKWQELWYKSDDGMELDDYAKYYIDHYHINILHS